MTMNTQANRGPVILFGVVALYVVLQFSWWAWLLVQRSAEVEALQQQLMQEGVQPVVPLRVSGGAHWMVFGEGGVFLVLVLVALWLTYRTVRHEWALARQQRDFLLAASHELRTPLAACKLHLQTAQRAALDADQRKALLGSAIAEIDRLHQLAEKILLATRLDQSGPALHLEPCDVAGLVRATVDHAERTYAHGHALRAHVPGSLVFHADTAALRSVVDNLLENACKYSPPATPVDIRLNDLGTGLELLVEDRGPGVPSGERSAIFRKFHRSGAEETRAAKGTGLGLFIVRRLIEAHGGTVSCRERPGGGATFVATIPKR
jgi:signal transduction histidine kinase